MDTAPAEHTGPARLTSMAELRSIIQSLMTKFHPAEDAARMSAVAALYAEVKARRAQQMAASRDALHQWMRKVEGAKWEAQRPADKSEAAHEERMAALERERYALGKATNELELSVQREEAALAAMRERAAAVAARTRALGAEAAALGPERVRCQLYRQHLGLNWQFGDAADASSLVDLADRDVRCLINVRAHNDVFTLDLCPTPREAREAEMQAITSNLWARIPPQ